MNGVSSRGWVENGRQGNPRRRSNALEQGKLGWLDAQGGAHCGREEDRDLPLDRLPSQKRGDREAIPMEAMMGQLRSVEGDEARQPPQPSQHQLDLQAARPGRSRHATVGPSPAAEGQHGAPASKGLVGRQAQLPGEAVQPMIGPRHPLAADIEATRREI